MQIAQCRSRRVGHWQGYNMDLGEILELLQKAMVAQIFMLSSYWADSPYEYSRDYPDPASVAKAAAMKLVKGEGLLMGKTFNSQTGGKTSDAAFCTCTLSDWNKASVYVLSEESAWRLLP